MNATRTLPAETLDGTGLAPARILTPAPGVDITRWAVVACDQFTSQPEYWKSAEAFVGNSPSALNMILPEAFLDAPDSAERERRVISNMRRTADSGILLPFFGYALAERRFDGDNGDDNKRPPRVGLIAAVDLEYYDYNADSSSPIRPTEGTIAQRLPPRAAIRREAALELPHIMLLLQDQARSVIEPVYARRGSLRQLYDAPLMLGGGSIKGWAIDNPDDISAIQSAIRALPLTGGVRAAVGDGNHSLAAARMVWMDTRQSIPQEQRAAHPLRFALAEVCNVYDEGISFEPIHRIVYGADTRAFMESFEAWTADQGGTLSSESLPYGKMIVRVSTEGERPLWISGASQQTAAGIVQSFLDQWPAIGGGSDAYVDYIHGDDALRSLASEPNRVGILLPSLDKSELFPAIAKDGVLPRKTFSMGLAREKRYYLEARKLR